MYGGEKRANLGQLSCVVCFVYIQWVPLTYHIRISCLLKACIQNQLATPDSRIHPHNVACTVGMISMYMYLSSA